MAVDFDNLELQESNTNLAVDSIMAKLASLVDDKDRVIFATVKRGLWFPESTPGEDDVPCARIWHDNRSRSNIDNEFSLDRGDVTISIYLYFYSFAQGEGGEPVDIQAQRERFVDHILRNLKYSGMSATEDSSDRPIWEYTYPQQVEVDHTQAFKRIANDITAEPPWYVTRIDIDLNIFEHQDAD